MSTSESITASGWAPDVCTLPTAERPTRAAEFDAMFRDGLREIQRVSATELRLTFDGDVEREVTIADLTARESACCSFFTFAVVPVDGLIRLDVSVPAVHAAVLDGLAAKATAAQPPQPPGAATNAVAARP